MISKERIMEKLEIEAQKMHEAVSERNWMRAKQIYRSALSVATFIEPNHEEYIKIWGNRPYVDEEDQIVEGWFDLNTIRLIATRCVELGIESGRFPMLVPDPIIKNSTE